MFNALAPDVIATIGVSLLLVAFVANLLGFMGQDRAAYRTVNAAGAGLAALSAWMIDFVPFVVLEGTWCAVSVAALIQGVRGGWPGRSAPTRRTGP